MQRFWNLGFHAVCEEYGTENVPIHELRDFYGHIFRGSCAKWARMWRLWERFAFVDRFGHYFNRFSIFRANRPTAIFAPRDSHPFSVRTTEDVPVKFAQALYGHIYMSNMECGWVGLGGGVKTGMAAAVLEADDGVRDLISMTAAAC